MRLLSSAITIFLMPPRKKPPNKPARKKQKKRGTDPQVTETISQVLSYALKNQEDFVLTYEVNIEDGEREEIHVLTGKLITPCMLGTLKNRVELQESEGSRRHTMEWK